MSFLRNIKVEWLGKEYTLPRKQLMRTIAAVEEVMTIGELIAITKPGAMRFAQLAKAHAILLRSAGVEVETDEIYETLFAGEGALPAVEAVNTLLALMIPPTSMAAQPKDDNQGNVPAPVAEEPA